MEGREPCSTVCAKANGSLPKTAKRRTNKEVSEREIIVKKHREIEGNQNKFIQSVTAKSTPQYLMSESRVKMCVSVLCNKSVRIASQAAIL